MRYIKYLKIITFGLFLLTLSFLQCSKETVFRPYPCIKGQVTTHGTNEPVDSAIVKLWIDGLGSDTLTYFTDSSGVYITERINNWFDKQLTIEASKDYVAPGKLWRAPDRLNVSAYTLNAKDSITSDTLTINFPLYDAYSSYHFVTPKKLDFLDGQYISYFFIINDVFGNILKWELGENTTEWMKIYLIRIVNAYDTNHLKRGGYLQFQVIISKLLTPGTYDSSILVITDQGTTAIPVHVVVK